MSIRTSRFVTTLVISCLILAQAKVAHGDDAPTQEIDVLSQLGVPAALVGQIVEQLEGFGQSWDMEATVTDADGEPAAEIEVVLRWDDGHETLTTNNEGKTVIEISSERLTGLTLELPAELQVEFSQSGAVQVRVEAGGGGDGDRRAAANLEEDFERLAASGIEVYYGEGHEQEAARALADLAAMRGFAQGYAGLKLEFLSSYGAVLTDDESINSISGRILIPLPVEAYGDGSANVEQDDNTKEETTERSYLATFAPWVLIHEWTEGTIVFSQFHYVTDQRLRFMGDGIAELLSYEYCRQYHPRAVELRLAGYIERAEALLAADIKVFDFAEDFNARGSVGGEAAPERIGGEPDIKESAGYALSFLFWRRVAEQGRPDAVREIVAWIMEGEDVNLESTLAKVEEVCGLEATSTVDVEQALAELRQLAGD